MQAFEGYLRSSHPATPWRCSLACMASLLNLLTPVECVNNSTRQRMGLSEYGNPKPAYDTRLQENSFPAIHPYLVHRPSRAQVSCCPDHSVHHKNIVSVSSKAFSHLPLRLLISLSVLLIFCRLESSMHLCPGRQQRALGLSLPFVNSCVFDQP